MRIKKQTAKTAKLLKPNDLMQEYEGATSMVRTAMMTSWGAGIPDHAQQTIKVLRAEIMRRLRAAT